MKYRFAYFLEIVQIKRNNLVRSTSHQAIRPRSGNVHKTPSNSFCSELPNKLL